MATRPHWAILLAGLALSTASAEFPPQPDPQEFLHDYEGLLSSSDEAKVSQIQQRCFEAFGTPIVVVTIDEMSSYGDDSDGIEGFAREWFDAWEVGDSQHNVGVLVLVSQGDRKARIELGRDWGSKWNDYCQRIMDREIVSRFKKRDFSGGIRHGVHALEAMAEAGPAGSPPSAGFFERLQEQDFVRKWESCQPIPIQYGFLMILVGVAMIVGSFFAPPGMRKPLLIVGVLLVLAGISVVLLALIFGSKGRRGGSGGGSGFSGGSSGGGGATGSW